MKFKSLLFIFLINLFYSCDSYRNLDISEFNRSKKNSGYSYQIIHGKNLNPNNETDFNRLLTGKIAGLQINDSSSSMFDSTQLMLRGETNIMFIVDGIKMNPEDINTSLIKSVKVIKGPHAVTRYGNEAINGVIIISTR